MSKSVISVYSEPTVDLSELAETDFDEDTKHHGKSKRAIKKQSEHGRTYPIIEINNYKFHKEEIANVVLKTDGFLPEISVELQPTDGTFTSTRMPVDGDLVKLFIRSDSNVIKPIRCDFLIDKIHVENNSEEDTELNSAVISIKGKLNVPHIYDEVSFVKDDTSFNTLQEIATQLKLGFASNVSETNDKMPWLCSYSSRLDFIQNIIKYAWKGETSFFTAYVDVYYNLNFVDVEAQLQSLKEGDDAFLGQQDVAFKDTYDDDYGKTEATVTQKKLSNHSEMLSTNYSIVNYEPINNSATIAQNTGYTSSICFYDYSSNQMFSFDVNPLMTEGAAKDKITLRGAVGDDSYKDQKRVKFMGIQYTDNIHDMYNFAKIHNEMNRRELEKMQLRITLGIYNLNFIVMDPVPIDIYVGGQNGSVANELTKFDDEEEKRNAEGNRSFAQDKFYSGVYLLKSFELEYNRDKEIQETMILTRREWPTPY